MQEASCWVLATAMSAVAGVFSYLLLRKKNRTNPLPGPLRLPLIGYSSLWGKVIHKELESLASKYGDVFGLYLGKQYVVVLSDYLMLKQVLEMDKTSANGYNKEKKAGEDFNERKELVEEVISNFLEEVENHGSEPVGVAETLVRSASDVICDMIHPKRLEKDSPKRKRVHEAIQTLLKHVHPPHIHVPFNDQDFPTIWDTDKLYLVTEEVIKTVRQEAINGCIQNHAIQPNNAESVNIEKELMKKIYFVLQTACSTAVATVEWTLLAVATQPEVQEKCMAEIDRVFGRKKVPEWNERHHLPYTIAVCMEAQRLYCVHPIAFVKQTVHDIRLGDRLIPEGSSLLSSIWTILHDPMYWLAPDQFHPERFLSSNRKNVSQPDFHVPLSFTHSGGTLVDALVFKYVVSILQKYSIRPYPVEEEPDMDGRVDIVHRPYLFDLAFTPRE